MVSWMNGAVCCADQPVAYRANDVLEGMSFEWRNSRQLICVKRQCGSQRDKIGPGSLYPEV